LFSKWIPKVFWKLSIHLTTQNKKSELYNKRRYKIFNLLWWK
jgi:hypothetical protein